jgi:hypothetical protein
MQIWLILLALRIGLIDDQPMTPEQADKRVILSRQVIATWERMGGPGGPVSDNLRLVKNEIEILQNIAALHEGKAAKIKALISRYTALVEKLQAMLA